MQILITGNVPGKGQRNCKRENGTKQEIYVGVCSGKHAANKQFCSGGREHFAEINLRIILPL